ncbi:MAG TPA: biopolymer transporter ExbD [Flavisolibacter sp.]
MPSVKIPRKSTWTDMTPFVDVAFLILAFFIMATKFKPPQPVEITTPKSVSADRLKEQDAVHIEMDKEGRVFFNVTLLKPDADREVKRTVINNVNKARNLGLTDQEIESFVVNSFVGVPLNKLKPYLAMPEKQRSQVFEGIPVKDSANNELATWIAGATNAFYGRKLNFLIKGDNSSKYPSFKGVIEALRRNDIFKYQLITEPESVPVGTDLYRLQLSGKDVSTETEQ